MKCTPRVSTMQCRIGDFVSAQVAATYWEAAVASAVTASRSTTPTPPQTNFDPVDTSLACFVLFATRALRRRAPNADAPRCVPTTGRLLTQAMVLSFGRSRDVLFQQFKLSRSETELKDRRWFRGSGTASTRDPTRRAQMLCLKGQVPVPERLG
mmetsp:Transcript_4987/g.22270  ORF Transcript_4987/g.22270 Transcript_4987/m.22270 type:complete len:154 (-) Transcript_4987:19-480(-)